MTTMSRRLTYLFGEYIRLRRIATCPSSFHPRNQLQLPCRTTSLHHRGSRGIVTSASGHIYNKREPVRQGKAIYNAVIKLPDSERDSHPVPVEWTERCAESGFAQQDALTIAKVVFSRMSPTWETCIAPEDVAAYLKNYRQWSTDSSSIPPTMSQTVEYQLSVDQYYDVDTQLSSMPDYPPQLIAEHLKRLALWTWDRGFELHHDFRRSDLEDNLRNDTLGSFISRIFKGIFVVEVAAALGDLEAATILLKFSQHRIIKELLEENRIVVNTTIARHMVFEGAQGNPDCPWETMSTYIEDDYAPSRLRKQSPQQLAWALQVLEFAASEKVDLGEIAVTQKPWAQFENPWKQLETIVIHCLKNSIAVPGYTQAKLKRLKEDCLVTLAAFNDPTAAFALAIRDEEYGSEEWQRLMECAAADANADACWLLAIHDLKKCGLFELGSVLDNFQSSGFEFAYVALVAGPKDSLSAVNDMMNRACALAALLKVNRAIDAGSEQLKGVCLYMEDFDFPDRTIARMYDHLEDYKGWSDAKCKSIIEQVMNETQIIEAARRKQT